MKDKANRALALYRSMVLGRERETPVSRLAFNEGLQELRELRARNNELLSDNDLLQHKVDKAEARIERLEAHRGVLMARSPEHNPACRYHPAGERRCVCGLDQVLQEIAEEREGVQDDA